MKARVLIIEDDREILKTLRRNLAHEEYDVYTAEDGDSGLEEARKVEPDLVILDIMLPGIDGYEVCRRLRKENQELPILMLTAKGDTSDRVRGLDIGADDYITKPFEIEELNARMRALLRRTMPNQEEVLSFMDLTLDRGTRRAQRGDRIISLTAKEYELLELFMQHPRQVLTREIIYDRVWGYNFGGKSNIIEVYVRYLRQKLEENDEPRLIHTLRGVGYVLRKPDQ